MVNDYDGRRDCSGVASMEQMEQLLPRAAKDHMRNSCKSDDILEVRVGVNKRGLRGICNAIKMCPPSAILTLM